MSVSPAPRQHAHTVLGAPNSSLRSRIPKPAPSRPGSSKRDPAHFTRPRSTSPRPAPLLHNSPPVRNRESLVASEDSHGQTVFLSRVPPRKSSLSRPSTRMDIPSSPDDPLFYQPPRPTFPLPNSRSVVHQRESMITQSSGQTSSSLYPPSSSSQTGPDSPPSPSTPSAHSSIDPVTTPGFAVDADDVSYRLRLLVRNNYFLPPAHSKPNHSELSLHVPTSAVPPAKTPSPTFRDLFRVGRPRTPSKGAPESPKLTKPPPAPSPVVRPVLPVRTATCPAPLSTAPSLREKERRGRVLVIRERIDDLVTAANSAEIDMRAREEDRRRREPPHASSHPAVVDLIDPTETVDLPAYQFPVQSSLAPFGGLGVDGSIGAAALAEALPPRPEDAEDEAWRKALLHKAVGLSMLSIPEPTPPPSQRSKSVSPSVPSARSTPAPSGSRPSSAVPPSPAPAPAIGRSIIPGSRLTALPPANPKSGIRSPGFASPSANRSPVSKMRELPIGSGSSPTASLPPPPRARTASKTSLSPASPAKALSPALSAKSLSPASISPSSPNKSSLSKLGSGRPSDIGVGRPSMLPVPKHTVRRALSTPMLAQKVGTAAANANAPPLPSPSSARVPMSASKLRPSTAGAPRSTTPTRPLRAVTPLGNRAPTPSAQERRDSVQMQRAETVQLQRARTPSIVRAATPSLPRATTPSLPRPTTPSVQSPADVRAPTPSPALLLETPEGHTMLPSRDTMASFTSGSQYSDDDEIVAVDDDEDEIVAVDDDDDDHQGDDETGTEAPDEPDEDDLRAPSRAGVMLRPDSRMTNATVVRPSFTEGRAASRMSNAMSAFGGARRRDDLEDSLERARSLSPPNALASSSQRNSIVMPSRSSTLMSDAHDDALPQPRRSSPPLNVRRSQVIAPLSLQPPPSIASTVAALRSAPPPASTDFFDAVYTRSLETGGLGFDSDSEPEPPMPIYVQPRSRAVSTTSAASARSRPGIGSLGLNLGLGSASNKSSSTVMHFSSRSNPYLATDPNPYQGLDPRKPVTNTPPASQTRFRGMSLLRPATSMGLRSSGRKSPHLIQHPAVRAGSSMGYAPGSSHGHGGSSHGHESIKSGAVSIRSEHSVAGRAARSEESIVSSRRQDPSLARLDGLYAMHIEAERDQMRKITAASRKPKPVAGASGAGAGKPS